MLIYSGNTPIMLPNGNKNTSFKDVIIGVIISILIIYLIF